MGDWLQLFRQFLDSNYIVLLYGTVLSNCHHLCADYESYQIVSKESHDTFQPAYRKWISIISLVPADFQSSGLLP